MKVKKFTSVFSILFLVFQQSIFAQTRVIVNPGLEFGVAAATVVQNDANFGFGATFDAGSAVTSPWYTSHSVQAGACTPGFVGNCHPIEVWGTGFSSIPAAQGTNYVELNAFESSMIYQNMYLANGDVINYYYRHHARTLTAEQAAMRIEDQNQSLIATVSTTAAPSSLTAWSTNQGTYTFTGTSGVYRVGFRALVNGGSGGLGNLLDDIRITLNPLIDLKFTNALSSCEGSNNGNLFLRINGAVTTTTTVAVQLINPANGHPMSNDTDITLSGVANSHGTPTVSHTAGSTYYLITIPAGNYDGGATPGYASPNNDEDGVALSITSVNDGIDEPDETFKFEIKQQGTNGSTSNFVSTSSPIFGDTYYPTTNTYFIQNCTDSDGDDIRDLDDLDDDNDGILDTVECPDENVVNTNFSSSNGQTVVFNAPAADRGFIFDIYTLDNSFNLNINGTNIASNEIQFTTAEPSLPQNIRFADGSLYEAGGISSIWGIIATDPDHPIVRVVISPSGTITLFGSKVSGGPLFPLTLFNGNTLNSIIWNTAAANVVTVSQFVTGPTHITGNGKGLKKGFCDFDGDGIPNILDLDSDNDGCPDAIEGDENVNDVQLVNAAGTLGVGTGSTSPVKNLCASNTCVNTNGVPVIVNSGGLSDIGSDQGQGIGSSEDASVNSCVCYNNANTASAGVDTKHGITLLQRAGTENGGWPMVRKSAHTVLESNTKGFVVTRLTTVQVNALVSPQEGMMVYDTDAKCLKLYDGMAWSCFNTPTCP